MMDRRVEVSRNIKATPWRRHLPYHASYLIKVLNFVQTHHLCRRRSLSVQLFKLYFQTAPDSKTFCTPRYFLTMICTRSILWIMNFYVLCINVQSCIWCVIVVLAEYLPVPRNKTCSKCNQVSRFLRTGTSACIFVGPVAGIQTPTARTNRREVEQKWQVRQRQEQETRQRR